MLETRPKSEITKERIYQDALAIAFDELSIKYSTEKNYPVMFSGKRVGSLRLDLVVEDEVIVEGKAVTGLMPIPRFKKSAIYYFRKARYYPSSFLNLKKSDIANFLKRGIKYLNITFYPT